ncbi:MAG: ArsR family transcriptional regulator [Candidatus Bathyarchaeota archaeon B26-1]|nr:MAG: ArsR family transcriptional regulator [Candidatus Bathyarchaeota archaeon B26-1]
MFTEGEIRKVSTILNALGNPTRFRIVTLINETKRPLHIKAVAQMLKMNYAAIYRHVKVLQESGLVGIYEVGRSRVLYSVDEELMKNIVDFAKKIIQKK